jgi:hypothetical protein
MFMHQHNLVPFVAFLMRKARGQPTPFQIPFSFLHIS